MKELSATLMLRPFNFNTLATYVYERASRAVFEEAAFAALLIVLRLLMGYEVLGFDLDRKAGLFLSTLAALGMAGGAFLKFQEDGGELPKSGGQSSGQPPTPF